MIETLQENQLPVTDTEPISHTQEIDKSEPGFKAMPAEWEWVRNQLVESSQEPDFPSKYGLADADRVLVFHGTTIDKAQTISSEGMKSFEEVSHKKPRIFVTASPTMALYHALERGPHDTLRAEGKVDYVHNPRSTVLLAIRVPKDWLSTETQSGLPLDMPQWLKDARGLSPDDDNRLNAFNAGLAREVSTLQQGNEVSDFGIPFPVDIIPPEYIEVIEPGDVKPIF